MSRNITRTVASLTAAVIGLSPVLGGTAFATLVRPPHRC